MHMRLIDERLKRGGYLNEFAFVSCLPRGVIQHPVLLWVFYVYKYHVM